MNIKEICEGCITYENRTSMTYSCYWVCIEKSEHNSKDLICPCSICLIKMMCVSACEELLEHQRKNSI